MQAHAKHRLAAISIHEALNSNGFLSALTPPTHKCSDNRKDNALALVVKTGDQLNETSKLLDIAKFEGNIFGLPRYFRN